MFLRSYRVWKVSYFQLTCLSHHQMARVTLPLTLGRGFRSRDSMGSTVSITIYWLLFITDQISNTQKFLKVLCHWIMLHGHENCVEDNTDGDAEVNKWVHDNGVEPLFEPLPTATAVPLQADVSKGVPTWRTRPLVVFKVWNTQQVREMMHSKYLHQKTISYLSSTEAVWPPAFRNRNLWFREKGSGLVLSMSWKYFST